MTVDEFFSLNCWRVGELISWLWCWFKCFLIHVLLHLCKSMNDSWILLLSCRLINAAVFQRWVSTKNAWSCKAAFSCISPFYLLRSSQLINGGLKKTQEKIGILNGDKPYLAVPYSLSYVSYVTTLLKNYLNIIFIKTATSKKKLFRFNVLYIVFQG